MPKICPMCFKSTQFQAAITHPGVVDLSGDVEKVVQESPKFVFEVRKCVGCGATVSNEALVDADYCADTKVLYPASELLDYQGRKLSKPAHALATRSELQGLSQHDLIAKLLELEAAAGQTPAPAKAVQTQETAEQEISASVEES